MPNINTRDRNSTSKHGDLKTPGILTPETSTMLRAVREEEQQRLRKMGEKVHARDHAPESPEQNQSLEGQLQNALNQHPLINTQANDGISPNVGPEPPLNTEARKKYDEAKERQEVEKQLRLGNMPKFGKAPTPRTP